jgi:hypothetical protein
VARLNRKQTFTAENAEEKQERKFNRQDAKKDQEQELAADGRRSTPIHGGVMTK